MPKSSTSTSKQAAFNKTAASNPSKTAASSSKSAANTSTGETNENYALVSILYHALQGAETYVEYLNDAEEAGDDELVEFVRKCQEEEAARAARARELLAERFDSSGDEGDEGDDDDDDD